MEGWLGSLMDRGLRSVVKEGFSVVKLIESLGLPVFLLIDT